MRFLQDETGASLVEYALLLLLMVVVSMTIMATLGGTSAEPFSSVVEQAYNS